MRNQALQHKPKGDDDPSSEVTVESVSFWRECPEDETPVTYLPVKLVLTEGNINGVLLFFETHGLMFCNQAVAQIRQEIDVQGEADVWLFTQR